MDSKYIFEEFVRDCGIGLARVFIWKVAVDTASRDFNLQTPRRILNFIGDGGLEKPRFYNSVPWEKNVDIMVDAYSFYSGKKHGYIAFFKAKTGRWNIKSFKKNIDPDVRNKPFEGLAKLLKRH